MSIENTILSHVLYDDDFARKVIPFLKDEYFQEAGDKLVFSEINKFREQVIINKNKIIVYF